MQVANGAVILYFGYEYFFVLNLWLIDFLPVPEYRKFMIQDMESFTAFVKSLGANLLSMVYTDLIHTFTMYEAKTNALTPSIDNMETWLQPTMNTLAETMNAAEYLENLTMMPGTLTEII